MKSIVEVEREARLCGRSYGAQVFAAGLRRSPPKKGERVCPHCGRAFLPVRGETRYCSRRCHVQAEMNIR